MDRIVCIVGPTASGKTRLSVELALAMGAEVVSFDSMQLYRRMDLGTAKPTMEERRGVPHHMFDVLEPSESCSVSRYVALADACVQDILSRGKPVILVGGTGLYIDALIAGRSFAPYPQTGVREELTALADAQGMDVLMQRLREVDPEAAARLHPSNRKRVIRALEVWLETGKTITQHDRESQAVPPKYHPVWLGLTFPDRQTLYDRIDLRARQMFDAGLAGEVQALLDGRKAEPEPAANPTDSGKTGENEKGATCEVTLRVLRRGKKGGDVRAMQRLLIAEGFSCGSAGADGVFGGGSEAALKAFQRSSGLSADGIAGTKTWTKLLGG